MIKIDQKYISLDTFYYLGSRIREIISFDVESKDEDGLASYQKILLDVKNILEALVCVDFFESDFKQAKDFIDLIQGCFKRARWDLGQLIKVRNIAIFFDKELMFHINRNPNFFTVKFDLFPFIHNFLDLVPEATRDYFEALKSKIANQDYSYMCYLQTTLEKGLSKLLEQSKRVEREDFKKYKKNFAKTFPNRVDLIDFINKLEVNIFILLEEPFTNTSLISGIFEDSMETLISLIEFKQKSKKVF